MIPPDYPHGSQENASSWPERPLDGQVGAAQGDGAQGSDAYPSGLVNDPGAARQKPPAATLLPFNISADEAARRITIARKLLSDAGVNPDSLSAEQMNIFSNQAPELQKDSLAMLARYGAERLQIIHPNNNKNKPDEGSASSTQTQSTHTAPGAAAPTTTKELSLQMEATPSRGKGTKSKGASAKDSKRKLGKSRLACLECKSRRVKCPKEIPTCAECQSHGRDCQYPPTKPRARKSNAVVEVEDDDDDAEDDEEDEDEEDPGEEDNGTAQVQHQQNPQHVSQGQTALPHEEPQDAAYAQMPLAGMLTPHAERTTVSTADTQPSIADHGYFQADTGLSMPQPDLSHLSQLGLNTAPGLALPQAQMYNAPEPNVNMPSVYPESGLQTTSSQSVSPKLNMRQPRGSDNANSAAWTNTSAVAPSAVARDNTASPVYPPPPAPSQQRTRQSGRMQANSPHLNNSATAHNQPSQLSQQPAQMLAAMQTQGRESPFPVQQRTSSRTSRSSQNRTPNADARGYRPPPPQNQPATSDLGVSASYNGHSTNSGTASSGLSTRGTYSTPATSTSQHAYDYNRSSQQTSTSANQWPSTAQNQQGQQTRSYETRPPSYSNTKNAYAQSRNATQPAVSAQGFDMRAAAQAKPANSRAGKQQTYSQYPSQSQTQTTQTHHQSSQAAANNQHLNQNSADWYGFNGGDNNSFTSANHGWL